MTLEMFYDRLRDRLRACGLDVSKSDVRLASVCLRLTLHEAAEAGDRDRFVRENVILDEGRDLAYLVIRDEPEVAEKASA